MEQVAHVGSEVDRAIRSYEAGRRTRWEAALDRAFELFDLTALWVTRRDRWAEPP